MGKDNQNGAVYTMVTVLVWIVFASLAAMFTYDIASVYTEFSVAISVLYVVFLLALIAVGNFARVRSILFIMSVYCIFVIIRAVYGVLIEILVLKQPDAIWFYSLDFIAMPFNGLHYISEMMTSHFVEEIYWCGIACISCIILCLSCLAFMYVTARNKQYEYTNNKQKNIEQLRQKKEYEIDRNSELLEKTLRDTTRNSDKR